MNTTLNDIITEKLRGRSVVIYEYDALFTFQDERRISHWYIKDSDEHKQHYQLETHWRDLQIKKHIGTIVSISGYHMDYEGTDITMVVNVDGDNKHIPINMEDTMEIMDGIKKHTMI